MEANYGVDDCGRYNIILYVQDKRFSKLSLYTKFFIGNVLGNKKSGNLFYTVLLISAKYFMCIVDILQYFTVDIEKFDRPKLSFFVVFVLLTELKGNLVKD